MCVCACVRACVRACVHVVFWVCGVSFGVCVCRGGVLCIFIYLFMNDLLQQFLLLLLLHHNLLFRNWRGCVGGCTWHPETVRVC